MEKKDKRQQKQGGKGHLVVRKKSHSTGGQTLEKVAQRSL